MKALITTLFLFFSVTLSFAQLNEYQPFIAQSNEYLILRKWQEGSTEKYWAVHPKTLQTMVLENVTVKPMDKNEARSWIGRTPYGRALYTEQTRAGALQDAGLTRTQPNEKGFSLTMDLCPSHKPLTRTVFEDLIAAFEPEEKPVPITITITGLWMQSHADDLQWLKNLEKRGDLRITWVNHSFHHQYDPKLPLTRNFLLSKGTNMASEVLLNEQAMIQNGLLPSIFFRFPGLISDQSIFDDVLNLGLLPLGSDAWLAKGQKVQPGSIVLIHPNGNEPVGIADFIKLIKTNASSIRKKDWLLYDLPASLSQN
ncbi:polysaccharide deacetylase [Siphonobacter sp. SORGH_AS_1065]|uniref:polysaccharide deacetylase family protein n=1 Tax=Siphonobacter sp. SORGH_AS_1065 TaxID=3041795 RepID=UPI00278A08FD|nr:polysaccharide deacetylase [Siphonobacter sp. SORGH_AS_1065]MDQ1088443.1 hypothetical protein [Siphonobacter sp. SORGH_AS_1065]